MKVKFLNFWEGYDGGFFTESLAKALCTTIEVSDNPDVVLHSCFGNTPPISNKPNIWYTHENYLNPDRLNIFKLPQFGLVPNTETSVTLPDWIMYYDKLLNPIKTTNRLNRVCSMFKCQYHHREHIINHYGAIKVNAPDKIDTLSEFRYNIAVENSYAKEYITEKLTDAFIAGCLPIYWGGDVSTTPFNKNKIIMFPNKLPSEDEYWEKFYSPVFSDNHKEMYEETNHNIKKFFEKYL
jgi:hypothetical protein